MPWRVLLVVCMMLATACEQSSTSVHYTPDPLQQDQWYLNGDNIHNAAGHINLTQTDYTGRGVLISLLDDDLDIYHEDIVANVGVGNYSYLPEELDFTDADHGTACAGIMVASAGNGKGGVGIAPAANIIATNTLKAPATSNLADALVREKERVFISNNSWGRF